MARFMCAKFAGASWVPCSLPAVCPQAESLLLYEVVNGYRMDEVPWLQCGVGGNVCAVGELACDWCDCVSIQEFRMEVHNAIWACGVATPCQNMGLALIAYLRF